MVPLNDQKHKRKLYGVCISGIESLGVASPLQQKLAFKLTTRRVIMMEVLDVLLPMGILVACAYLIGYLSGSEQTREIYDPVMRKKDLERFPK